MMQQRYTVMLGNKSVETHDTPGQALRAMFCIMAQENQYGRSRNNVWIMPATVIYLDEMPSPLPQWIIDTLGEEFINSRKRPT